MRNNKSIQYALEKIGFKLPIREVEDIEDEVEDDTQDEHEAVESRMSKYV